MQRAVINTVKLKYYIAMCETHIRAAKNEAVRRAFLETLADLKRIGGYIIEE